MGSLVNTVHSMTESCHGVGGASVAAAWPARVRACSGSAAVAAAAPAPTARLRAKVRLFIPLSDTGILLEKQPWDRCGHLACQGSLETPRAVRGIHWRQSTAV